MKRITIRQPDDWHLHLRDGAVLDAVLPWSAAHFGRAIIMPNLKPPITTVAAAEQYRRQIVAGVPAGSPFTPLMTCYLTDSLTPETIKDGAETGVFTAAKLYPAGATTNSEHGVTDIGNIYPVLEMMQAVGLPLLIHGEVVDRDIDIFDREAVFVERVLMRLIADFPALKIVSEHITTKQAAQFVSEQESRIGATITTHHLMINRNAIFEGGIRPHMYCLPIAKREEHRLALRAAATSGDPHFFLGTDSAPHIKSTKENDCGCAGVFNSPNTLSCLAQVFEEEDALDQLEAFASLNGPRFYGLAPNSTFVTLERVAPHFPDEIPVDGTDETIKLFTPPVPLSWRVQE